MLKGILDVLAASMLLTIIWIWLLIKTNEKYLFLLKNLNEFLKLCYLIGDIVKIAL